MSSSLLAATTKVLRRKSSFPYATTTTGNKFRRRQPPQQQLRYLSSVIASPKLSTSSSSSFFFSSPLLLHKNNHIHKPINMRPSSFVRLFLATSPVAFMSTDALPFTRNGKKDDNNNNNNDNNNFVAASSPTADAVVDNGNIIAMSRRQSNRNVIVEHYYHNVNHDDATTIVATTTTTTTTRNDALATEVKAQAMNLTDFLLETRRTLHQHPELMFQEEFTSQTIQAVLNDLSIAYSTGWAVNQHPDVFHGPGGYGIVADIGTGHEPCVLLRADMDALPVMERTEGIDDYASKTPGQMHACGHDAHTTMLLGAAAVLKGMEQSLPGTVRIMFQPAEEGGAGAKRMREEGVLTQSPKPSHAFGMHVWPTLKSGVVAGRPGPLMAACERFEILLHGRGGHAAMPHETIDPVVTASAIVMNLQTIVSRTISPLEAGVCSITQIDTGSGAFNVIPHSATLKGTVRSLSTETLLKLRDRVQNIVESTASAHGCNVTITYSTDYYPVTVNDPDLYESFSQHVGALVSEEGKTQQVEPTMGAEDFSFIAETIPSTFFFLGTGSGSDPPTDYGLHHPHFALDESVLPRGVELHVNLAVRGLAKLMQQQQQDEDENQPDTAAFVAR